MFKKQLDTELLPREAIVDDGPTVLVVDDDQEMRDSLQYALSSYNMQVTLCENATEALLAAMGGSFDFIITDYKMPGMDGIELVRRLRAQQPPLTVIIGMSGMSVGRVFLEAGANDFLLKPFVPYDLAMMIDGGDILA